MSSDPILRWFYPVMVGVWIAAHFFINARAARLPAVGSTTTRIDQSIPFVPSAFILYLSGFVLANLAYGLPLELHERRAVAAGYLWQFATSLTLYWCVPRRAPRNDRVGGTGPSLRLIALFQQISRPFNAFPSMHVSFCLFGALWIWRHDSGWIGVGALAWTVLVALATLLTHQHSIVDAAAGAALGASAVVLSVVA